MSERTALDADLFASLKTAIESVNDVEVMQAMMVIDQSEYTRFVTNEVENPQFRVKKKVFDTAAANEQLAGCLSLVEGSDAHEVVIQLYRAKLNNQQLRFELLAAASKHEDELFTEVSQTLYGKPRRDYFAMLVHQTLRVQPADKQAEAAAEMFRNELSHVAEPEEQLPTDMLPPTVEDDSEPLDANAVAEIFRQTLEEHDLANWEVRINENGERQRFSVNPYRNVVHVPNSERLAERPQPLTKTATEALAAHEIGVHAKRADAGYRSGLQLLGLGLDGYLRGEEGLASYSQQQIEGAHTFYGQDRYLAISLALGLDGEPRDFRGVFSLMQAYYELHEPTKKPGSSQNTRRAWDVCQRIFRGTTGQSAGCVFTRDLAYFEGNVAIWDYIAAHPERYPHLFIGKFDPCNDRHVTSLQTLELLPEW